MAKFRKRPVVIEAEQWLGTRESWDAIMAMGSVPWKAEPMGRASNDYSFLIHTLEGDHLASQGDWIIKGVNGEFYPCKPDIFAKTYEAVEELTPTARGEGGFGSTGR